MIEGGWNRLHLAIDNGDKKMKLNRLEWNIHSLKEGENRFHFYLEPQDLAISNNAVNEKIECDFILKRDGLKVYLQGVISFTLQLECARCFERFVLYKKEELSAYFVKREPFFKSEKESLSQTDTLTEYYENDTINLAPVFLDTIILSIPIKPLCKEDCKGLCPICGANLNIEQCGCKKKSIDPRWEQLKKLKEKK